MANINIGDRVKIKNRTDWYIPTGYKVANVEGSVFEFVAELPGYVLVLLDEEVTGIDKNVPLAFRIDAVDKI
jgi:hypothetical protein